MRTNSTLPQTQRGSLVARGLAAVQQSLAVAEQESAESLFKKGMRFTYGEDGVPQDSGRARAYLSAAAKLDHAEAQFELCVLLGEYDEWSKAVGWLEKSVSLGFGPAQRYLADGLSDTLITEHLSKDDYNESQLYQLAEAWYEHRASSGEAEAQYDFASWLNHLDCPMHDRVRAMRWMRAAAQQHHGFACMRFGEMLLEATGPEHSTEQGIYWLSRAADLGKSRACQILGDLYLFGRTGGRYARGRVSQIMAPDKREAVSWYERQIELEKRRGSFLGAHSLARLYLAGEHLDQDLALAERMLLDAANAGNLDSQRLLASEYASGKRLKRNPTAALHWLKMAEQNGSSSKREDQFKLGYFYEHDSDGAPNYSEAITWYRKAANRGDYRSLKSLGSLYESGRGVSVDYVEAYKWYLLSIATSYGKAGIRDFHAGALKSRDLLAQKMNPSQLAEACQLARAWMDQVTSLHATDHDLAREGLDRAS